MQLSNSPGKLVLPFAASGNKNSIPVASQIGITPGAASLADGFPPLTMTPVAAGGVPPSGLDMNGILYEMSAIVRWANAGGGYAYDADFATSDDVAGYPKGARVLRADGSGYWFNTVDNNETDPDSGGAAGWVPDFTSGAATVPMASANVTLTPVQYGKPVIIITGALTADLNLVFPNIVNSWIIINLTTGGYLVTIKTASDAGFHTAGGFNGLAVCDSTAIYIAGSNYKTARNVTEWGALGNGVAVDQIAIEAAIARCYSTGDWLYWPDGTFVSDANILNFHNVHHFGPGIIKRGSDLFHVTPIAGATNNLYVSPAGDDANDGLSAAQPKLTIKNTGDCIYKYSYGDANWYVWLSAGTFTESLTFSKAFPTPNRVNFMGDSVARGVQPTTIIQSPAHSLGTSIAGMYFQNNIRAQVANIDFVGFKTNASVNPNSLSAGVLADGRCELFTDNVWTDGCDNGVYVTNGSQARIQAGRHGYNTPNGVDIQFIRHAEGTVGYGGTAADINGATGTACLNGTYGVLLQEFSMAHTDNCYMKSKSGSGVLANSSRVHSVSSTYDSCTVGIDARYNSNLGDTTNTFVACSIDTLIRSGSRYAGNVYSEGLDDGPPIKEINVVGGVTQSTSPVTLFTKDFSANELKRRAAGFKLKIYGEVVGVAGTKTFTFTLGATTLKTYTIAASTTDFELNVELFNVTAASSQKCMTRKIENGVLGVTDLNVSVAENLTAAKTLTVTYNVANAADAIRVGIIDLEIQH